MGLKFNKIQVKGIVMIASGECGIFIWRPVCCCVEIWVFSFLKRKVWWFNMDLWRWFWVHGCVVDREEGVGGCACGGGLVGSVADWWWPVLLRRKFEDE